MNLKPTYANSFVKTTEVKKASAGKEEKWQTFN